MRRRTWGIAGAAVVVLAAAGTTTAVLLSGDDGDYKSLPTCKELGVALPGKPTLTVGQNVTDAVDARGMHPAYTNIQCEDGATEVDVELHQASTLNLITDERYPDGKVHDGRQRASDIYANQTLGFDELKPGVRYGSYGAYIRTGCTVVTLRRNATVLVTVPNPPTHSLDEWKAACRQIAENQVPKVVDAALG
jgi:hypothetical protein